ncbi:hypothetical protein BDR06DRAFT_616445 [Suillus hirtellus]|nr:hypothetical protein BDR06DRAFT_616445 [Suillus hirtellus]
MFSNSLWLTVPESTVCVGGNAMPFLTDWVLNIMPGASHSRPSFKRIFYHWSAVAIRHPNSHDNNNLSVLGAQHLVTSPRIFLHSPVDVAVLKFGLTLTEHGKLTIQLRHAYGLRVGPGITVRNGHITFLATFDAQSVFLGRRWNPLMGLVWRLQCS